MKLCSKCGRQLPYSMFTRDIRTKSGYHSHCSPCRRAVVQATQERHAANGTGPTHHVCSKCRVLRPIEAFGKDHSATSGHYSQCKGCKYTADRKREDKLRDQAKAVRERFYEERAARMRGEKT